VTWHERAACRGLPIEVFFPDQSRGPGRDWGRVYEAARATCARCPVVRECLEEDLRLPRSERYGFRAGMTESRRRRLPSPRRPRADHGTEASYRRHRRHGEAPCPACARGHSRRMAEGKARAKQRKKAA
jgi:WhiB family redox-sensing transcriptional regulator